MKNKKSKNILLNTLTAVCIAVFAVSGFMFIKETLQKEQEKAAFDKLSNALHEVEEQSSQQISPERQILEHYKSLKKENPHFAGWIRIEDTQLDYPVMYTPDNPEYYLRRSFDGNYSISGTPFIGDDSKPDSQNVLIYGHRMNNDTMFTVLLEYANKEFWEQHKIIRFDTVNRLQTYEIVSAFYIEIPFVDDKDAFRWYNYSGDLSEKEMEYYIQQIKSHAYYDTGIDVQTDDRLITLTTCAYNDEEQRFVVVAKLVK